MKSLAVLPFEILACSGALLALYAVLLERRVHFVWCRRYLLATTLLAAIIPLVHIPVWPGEVILLDPQPEALPATAGTPAAALPPLRPAAVAWALYAAGTALIAGLAFGQILRIRRLRRTGRLVRTARYRLVRTRQRIASFSFFGSIYVWEQTPEHELPAILAHETSHIRHRHSAERLAMEALRVLMWWNPFVWIAACRLGEVHEFEADSDVLESGFDRTEYMSTIFRQLFGYSPEIANGLRNSLTKKRFKMMTTPPSRSYALLRMAAVAPVVAGLVCAFSLTTRAAEVRLAGPAAPTTDLATAASLTDGDHKPLIVVDGVEQPSLDGIDAAYVDKVTVLKDQSAAALYGERARHGVIIVTLKEGNADSAARQPADAPAEEAPRAFAEVMPRFRGGDLAAFRQWAQEQPRDPATAKKQGRVVVLFIVEHDGSVKEITIQQSPDKQLSEEAVRIVKLSSGAWTPGRQQGRPVRVRFVVPIDFRKQKAAPAEEAAGKPAKADEKKAADKDQPFLVAEVMPLFRGESLNVFRQWAMMHVRYPAEALKAGIQGRVVLQFVVERDGTVSNIVPLQSPDERLTEEAVRVVALSSGEWTPGRNRGEAVRVKYTLPVDFRCSTPDTEARPATITVRGKVVDTDGKPLAGALIVQHGSTTGAVTDREGNFAINVPENTILDVSLVGHAAASVQAQADLRVVLTRDGATSFDTKK